MPGQHGNGVFKLRPLPDQIDQISLGTFQLRLRLRYRVTPGNARAVLVLSHLQRTLIRRNRGFEQTLLLINDPQLQIVLHQLRLLAQTHRRQIGEARLGTGLIGLKPAAQLAPDIGFPTDAQLRVVGIADTAGGTAQA